MHNVSSSLTFTTADQVEAPCILALAELHSSLAFATSASLRLGAYYTLRCIA